MLLKMLNYLLNIFLLVNFSRNRKDRFFICPCRNAKDIPYHLEAGFSLHNKNRRLTSGEDSHTSPKWVEAHIPYICMVYYIIVDFVVVWISFQEDYNRNEMLILLINFNLCNLFFLSHSFYYQIYGENANFPKRQIKNGKVARTKNTWYFDIRICVKCHTLA